MAHIERRVRNGKVTYRDLIGREYAKVFARKADAQRFLTEMENNKLRGTWTDPALGRVLFRGWLAEWWTTTTNLRSSTRARDEMLLRRYAVPRFGDLALVTISQRDVRAWVAELSAGPLAPATVQKAYQLLGKVMGAAVDAGMPAQSPCRRVPLPKVEREEMQFLTPAEIARLADVIWSPPTVACASGSWPGCAVVTSTCSGDGHGGADRHRGRGRAAVRAAQDRAGRRTVGLPRAVVEELAAHLAGPGDPEAFVFTAPQGGPLRVIAFRARVWRRRPAGPT